MPTIQVAIAGATGYSGEELIRLLSRHPYVQLTHLAASAKWDRPTPVSVVYPHFASLDLSVESFEASRFAGSCDVAFLALPHGAAMQAVPQLLNGPHGGTRRVIDLSGDFRLRDETLYPAWYKFEHTAVQLLKSPAVAYGLTEYHRADIEKARVVANPGCYATSILLGVLPLFNAGLVEEDHFIVDAKSGFSGAGRNPQLAAEMKENFRPYKVNAHQHMPEVLQAIRQLTGRAVRMVFVPQVIPVARGLMSMIYVKTRAPVDAIVQAYRAAYSPERAPFVRLRENALPQLQDAVNTNYCDIGLVFDAESRQLIIGSALDNLTKGAAGQAVQNFNVMHGFPETTGLV